MNIIEMREKRTKLLATMDGFLETHRNDKGVLNAEDDAVYAGMEKDLAALTNEIKRMERREAIDAELSKPVSSPITGKGQIIFGIGCGLITVFIRYFGTYSEGVCFAIIIMNCAVWLIDRYVKPVRFGFVKSEKKEAAAK